ncbi:MAG: hypothetical protein RMK29_09735 [Myxococcales bacterium]|nr:hypothetical protein [Myxococcales bacterium]
MKEKFLIGVRADDPELLRGCSSAVSSLAETLPIPTSLDLPGHCSVDLVLWALGVPPCADLEPLARWRARYARVPILLMGHGLSADEAVELVQCGVRDFLSLPPDWTALGRKVRRILLGRPQPAFDTPLLSLWMAAPQATAGWREPEPEMPNRRHCFRARLPCSQRTVVQMHFATETVEGLLADLSVETEGHWGGMLLIVDGTRRALLPPADQLVRGLQFCMTTLLPEHRAPLELQARLIRVASPPSTCAPVRLGVQYGPPPPAVHEAIRRFWLMCQRRLMHLVVDSGPR